MIRKILLLVIFITLGFASVGYHDQQIIEAVATGAADPFYLENVYLVDTQEESVLMANILSAILYSSITAIIAISVLYKVNPTIRRAIP